LPVLTTRLSAAEMVGDFRRCAVTADYVAGYAASDRFDPLELSSRLSACLGEVLELAHRHGSPEGEVVLEVARESAGLRVRVAIPVDPARRAWLREALALVEGVDAGDRYRAGFLGMLQGTPPGAGLLEQVALHGVEAHVEEVPGGLVVTVRVPDDPRQGKTS
jgi:hypothetical protein